jgi:hypothetical protein
MSTTRRRLLASTAVAAASALAGCSAVGSTDRTDATLAVRVRNRSDRAQTVSVTVTDDEGTVRDRVAGETIPAGVSAAFDGAGYGPGRYTIRVEGDGWATGDLWDPAVCRAYVSITTLEEVDGRPTVAVESACEPDD